MTSETFRARPVDRMTRAALLAAPVLVLIAFAGTPFLFSLPLERVPIGAKAEMALMPVVIGVAVFVIVRFRDRARLVVDDAGIRLETGMPAFLGTPSWSLAWSEIGKVRTVAAMGIIQLQRKGSLVRRPLRVHDWIPAEGPAPAPQPKLAMRRPDMRTAPLWKTLERRGLFARGDMRPDATTYDLAKHPATRAALIVMAALAAYAAVDFFLARERWAVLEPAIFAVPGAIGAVGALLAWGILARADRPSKIPAEVSGPLALVVGLAVGVASFYGLLRVNQWAAPLEAHDYVRNVSCNALDPVEPGLPAIEYDVEAYRYWCSFPREQRHTVLLRRGLGGMDQVDLTEHTRAIREFNARAAAAAQRR